MLLALKQKWLQNSLSDVAVVLSGIVCIIVGSVYFNSSSNIDAFRNVETFGTISVGSGSRKLGNSLQWFNVNRSEDLYYGDMIFANEQKEIEIDLLDGSSKMVVPEGSMIKITKSGGEFNIDISRGSVLIKSKKKKKVNLIDKRGRVRKLVLVKDSNVKVSTKKSNVTVEALVGRASISKIDSDAYVEVKKGKILLVAPKKTKVVSKIQLIETKTLDPLFETKLPFKEKYKNLKQIELSKSDSFKELIPVKIEGGAIDIRNLDLGAYYIRQPESESYDSFELREKTPLEIKIAEKEKYFQGDDLKITWNGRSELMYRVEIDGETPISKLVQGNEFNFSIQNSENINIQITEQRFNRSSAAAIAMNVSKDLDIGGIEESVVDGKNLRQLKLKNLRQLNYRVQIANNQNN